MADLAPDSDLRFGRVVVRPGARQLLVDDRPAAIGARAFDVLVALAEHQDRVVGKRELMDLVWPDVVVEENNLHVQIAAIRKLLGVRAVATIPGRGYRLTLGAADVQLPEPAETPAEVASMGLARGLDTLPADTASATPADAAAPPRDVVAAESRAMHGRRWFAVLAALLVLGGLAAWLLRPSLNAPGQSSDSVPLRSVALRPFSAGPGDATLPAAAAKLTVDITRALGDSTRRLRFVPPSIVETFRGASDAKSIGRQANVRFLLEGEVRSAGSKVEVTMRLLDTLDGGLVDIAKVVADSSSPADLEAVVPQITAKTRVMFGWALTRGLLARGERAATAEDLVQLADTLPIGDPVARAREGLRLANAAMALDRNMSRAWSMRASCEADLFLNDFSTDGRALVAAADADSLRAVMLNENDPVGWVVRSYVLRISGNVEGAFAALDRAQELDPTRYWPQMVRTWLLLAAGTPGRALENVSMLRRVLGEHDAGFALQACAAHLLLGSYAAATAECERAEAGLHTWETQARLAAAYAMQGDSARAARARDRLLAAVPAFTISRYEERFLLSLPQPAKGLEQAHLIAGLRKAGVPE